MAKGLQGLFRALRAAARAALLLTVVLLPLSDVAMPQDMPASGVDPGFNKIVANHLNSIFKNRATYDAFATSAFRWVHSLKGWAWMTCVCAWAVLDSNRTAITAAGIQSLFISLAYLSRGVHFDTATLCYRPGRRLCDQWRHIKAVSVAGGKKSKDFFVIAGRGALRPDFPSPNPG
jgi:hypothetical protein